MSDDMMPRKGNEPGYPDIRKVTAAEYLLSLSENYKAAVRATGGEETSGLNVALVPRTKDLPEVSAYGQLSPEGVRRGGLSVGNENLRYSGRVEESPDTGPVFIHDYETGIGPFKGFFRRNEGPNFSGTKYGGSVGLGPVTVYGEQGRSSQDVIPPEYREHFVNPEVSQNTRTFGATGSLPVGQGRLSGGVSRQFLKTEVPQPLGVENRPVFQNPNVTNYRVGYQGRVGPGDLNLFGNLTNIRNVGTEKSLEGNYNVQNPFGLGGRLTAQGSYRNPYGDKSAAEGMLRYRLPLGGR